MNEKSGKDGGKGGGEGSVAQDGLYVVVLLGGRKIFEKGIPIPNGYEEGKVGIMMLGGDAMAAVTGYVGTMEVRRLKKELEELKKGMEETDEDEVE